MTSSLPRIRKRKGSALILVLLMTLAVAALAIAAIFMTSSAGLLSRFYDKERLFALAAEAGLEMALSNLQNDPELAVLDTGTTVLLSGVAVNDASGAAIPNANVFVYAAVTGDTSATAWQTVTLIARAYDSQGTRHVRRMDLRRESLSRFTVFVDTFPGSLSFGPVSLRGRAHSNSTWRSATNSAFSDTLTSATGFAGSSVSYGGDSITVGPLFFPRDSTFSWMATRAATANLSHTVSGTDKTRLEFVAYDADGDGTVEETESWVRVFVTDSSSRYVRADPTKTGTGGNIRHDWADRIIQNQCGAFYRRSGRWHFFPVSVHRATWAWTIINTVVAGDYPSAPTGGQGGDAAAAKAILQLPTSRCFPAGSPYLVNTERMTTSAGVISATPGNNNYPWGSTGTTQYGGSDTTFTRLVRTCDIRKDVTTGRCTSDNADPLGTWQTFGGTADATLPDSMRSTHWPLHRSKNANATGIVNASGAVYVSGTVRGQVTLRVAGNVRIIDALRYDTDPNDPGAVDCANLLGIVATGGIFVADNLMTRTKRIGTTGGATNRYVLHLGGEQRTTIQGFLLSLTGTVGVDSADVAYGTGADLLDCPTAIGTASSTGGCVAHTGGAAMKTFSVFWGTANRGMRQFPIPDRCSESRTRPPYFPSTNRYVVLRTFDLEASRANTPAKVVALLTGLKGKTLD